MPHFRQTRVVRCSSRVGAFQRWRLPAAATSDGVEDCGSVTIEQPPDLLRRHFSVAFGDGSHGCMSGCYSVKQASIPAEHIAYADAKPARHLTDDGAPFVARCPSL